MANEPQIPAALSFDGLGDDARAALDVAATNGYSGVAISTNHPQLRPADLSLTARRHFRKILESHHLGLAALRVAVPRSGFADPATIDRSMDNAQAAITMAGDLGITTVALNVGQLGSTKVSRDTLLAAARQLASLATHAGITLALSGDGTDNLHKLLADLRCPLALANLVPRQSVESGEDPLTAAAALAGQIGQLTAADAIRAGSKVRAVELGEGQIPWSELWHLLQDQDFHGPLVVNVRELSDPATAAATAARALRPILLR